MRQLFCHALHRMDIPVELHSRNELFCMWRSSLTKITSTPGSVIRAFWQIQSGAWNGNIHVLERFLGLNFWGMIEDSILSLSLMYL